MGQEFKFEQDMTPQELKELLSRLADGLADAEADAGSGPELAGLPLKSVSKLKIGIKRTAQGFECKVKAKVAGSPEELAGLELPSDAAGKPKYKSLKKRMKSTFKAVTLSLLAGEMPAEALVTGFVEDSRLMVTYPGNGDEFYPVYSQAVDGLEAAYKAQDLEAMRKAALELSRLKSECHERYD